MGEEKLSSDSTLLSKTKRTKHLIFNLGIDKFAVPLTQVKEVVGMMEITTIPHVPAFFKGLINLRGKIISVIDLREKLSLPKPTQEEEIKRCIIISEVNELVMGVIVDDVSAVIGYEESHIERNINIQSKISREFILGVAKDKDQHLTLLLDLSRVLNIEELALLKKSQK